MSQENIIIGKVTDSFLCKPIGGVKIILKGRNKNVLSTSYSSAKGIWRLNLRKEVYSAIFEITGFVSKEVDASVEFPKIIRLLENKLIGYQNKLWFNPGEKVSAFIHSPKDFSARLIRHGINNTEILKLGRFPAIFQNIPNEFFVDKGLMWKEAFSYEIPVDAESGLYSLKLFNNNETEYSITFVVQPNKADNFSNKRILVLASTNNWQAYNIWGGRSRYRNFENPKTAQIINDLKSIGLRFVPETIKSFTKNILRKRTVVSIKDHPNAFQFRPLSLRRPHPNCSINEEIVTDKYTSHLAPGEWRILAWLEKEKFTYDLISGYGLHNNPDLLKNYDVVVLSTHCEYWSREMFSALKTFYNDGGSILNLSGNSIYREIEFLDKGDLRCTSLRFADSVEDETQIIGVRFDMKGYGSCAPFKVVSADHWVFANTEVQKGHLFAQHSLNHFEGGTDLDFEVDPASKPGMAPLTGNGGSGWETDKISSTAPNDIVLLAKGTNSRGGGANMIIREPNGKGIMFSASSITFGGTLLIDNVCSRIVKNVLSKALDKKR
ncbi:MAG TPA: N,N-dimethylformamidase beta subunit family domain-containing protein [Ignavibacteriaceae bacterium]|nr:N,N-dimethylformamidase beta subunit family domain-containing protein [Ignavibacteriaceae bacterium]